MQFDFKSVYYSGSVGSKPGALTARSRDWPKEGDNYSLENQITIIKLENILEV
jgi:hypothetical protein